MPNNCRMVEVEFFGNFLCSCIHHDLFIHLSGNEHVGYFYLSAVVNNATMPTCVHVLIWISTFSSLGYIPRAVIKGSDGNSIFNYKKATKIFSTMAETFHIPPAIYERFNVATFSQTLGIVHFLNFSHPSGHEVVSCCGFDLHFPSDQCCHTTFHMLIGHLYIFFRKMSIQALCPFFKLGCLSYFYCIIRVLYIF